MVAVPLESAVCEVWIKKAFTKLSSSRLRPDSVAGDNEATRGGWVSSRSKVQFAPSKDDKVTQFSPF